MSELVRKYGGARRRRRVVRRRRGGGIGDWFRKAHDWIKSNKIISTVGKALGTVGVPYAGAIGTAASTLGYGRRRRVGRPRKRRVVRRRRVGRRRVGGSLRSILTKAHGFVRSKKLISAALNHFGHSKLASAASALGYGRRRRYRRRRVGGARKRRVVRRRVVRRRMGMGMGLNVCNPQIAMPRY